MFFKRKHVEYSKPTSKVRYPIGSFLRTPSGIFYVKSNSDLLRIISERVLRSWSPPRVVETSDEAIAGYKVKAKLGFRAGSLIHSQADGKMYLIELGKRRWITSPDAFELLNASFSDCVAVSIPELNLHEIGEDIT